MLTLIKVRARTIVEDQAQVVQEDPGLQTQELEQVAREMPAVVILATSNRVEAIRAGRPLQPIL